MPWRWQKHNPALGHWLLELRHQLSPGSLLDLSDSATPPGVTFLAYTPDGRVLWKTLRRLSSTQDSVLVLSGRTQAQTRSTARRLGIPGYTATEDINGNFMREQLTQLSDTPPSGRASWTAELAKACFSRFATIDGPVLNRLQKGRPTGDLNRPDVRHTLAALDKLTDNPDLTALAVAMHTIARAGEGNLHSPEAWQDTATAISATANTLPQDCTPTELRDELLRSLSTVRNRLHHTAARQRRLCVSRTVLAKGLEYDHVVIANLTEITDTCNLYVALTRARRSITIIGKNPQITTTTTKGTPAVHLG